MLSKIHSYPSFNIQVNHLNFTLVSVIGLWTGLTICASLQSIAFITFLCKLDWKKAAEEVRTYTSSNIEILFSIFFYFVLGSI